MKHALTTVLALGAGTATAQPFTIESSTIDAGGVAVAFSSPKKFLKV